MHRNSLKIFSKGSTGNEKRQVNADKGATITSSIKLCIHFFSKSTACCALLWVVPLSSTPKRTLLRIYHFVNVFVSVFGKNLRAWLPQLNVGSMFGIITFPSLNEYCILF